MRRTPSSTRPLRPAVVALLAVALTIAAGLVTPTTPAGAVQTAPWGTWLSAEDLTSQGVAPRTSLVGDSLIYNIGTPATSVADHMRTVTGRRTHVWAVAGASWTNFGWPGQQAGYPLVWDMADADNARLTVVALATNDARIMTSSPADYDQAKQYDMMANAVSLTRQHSTCVMLVNVRKRGVTGMSSANAGKVNDNMTWLSAVYSGGGVHVADWNAHAAGHDSQWFISNDVHMTAAGELEYAAFISAQAQSLMANNGC